jgi:hypothetical protein
MEPFGKPRLTYGLCLGYDADIFTAEDLVQYEFKEVFAE